MDLYIATLIIQDAQFAARKAAARRSTPAQGYNGLLAFLGANRTR